MKMLGNIKLDVDSFLKDTRVVFCRNLKCRFNQRTSHSYGQCIFKAIELDYDGVCVQLERGRDDNDDRV